MHNLPELAKKESLLNRKLEEPRSKVNIFMEICAELKSVSVEPEGLTTCGIMLAAIEKFNRKFKTELSDDLELYELFAAGKRGKKKTDLPAMEGEQLISKTNIKNFYLQYYGKTMNTI